MSEFVELLLVAILPAFCEEFIHRGVLLQGIKHAGFKKAIVISSLMFGLIHFNIQQFFYAFIIGLILGFVSVVAKNISKGYKLYSSPKQKLLDLILPKGAGKTFYALKNISLKH